MDNDTRKFEVTYRRSCKWFTETFTGFEAAWNRRRELLATPRVTQVKLPTIVE